MKAFVLEAAAGPEAAKLTERPRPEPGHGEVSVALRAAALNHRELWISRGLYPGMTLPTVLGADGAGVVDGVGEGVPPDLIGREVVLYPGLNWGEDERFPGPSFGLLGMPGPGTVAETICVPAVNAFAKPAHLDFVQAAALPVAALTAFRAVTIKAGVSRGDNVLVTGVGGGVATFALLFAHALGANVYVTSGSREKIDKALESGAVAGFDYRETDWGKRLRAASGGVDVVIDGSPASAYPGYGRALRNGARMVLYGSTGGTEFPVSAPELFLRHASIIGTAMGSPADFKAMLAFVEAHRIVPLIDRIFAFDQAPEALLHLEGGDGFGKVVVEIGA